MVTTDVEHELRKQLKEAGRQLSDPPDSISGLLHILDQLEKLLSMVDQSPNHLMQEALKPPIKALVNGSLLEHSSMDVKVSVASCLCEITRVTAPEAPYSDEEMKRVFQCIVSSFEDLSDISSRYYAKRVSILETVSKVRSCVIMLDLECNDLIVKLFEYFLNSVRDHHLSNIFPLMMNIMTLVLEESEDISLEILKPLLASTKNNSEGVLPVARKLGEEVIKKSADKLRPFLNKAVTILGDSLGDYSQVLTSICEGTTKFVEHNDENASVQTKVVDGIPPTVSLDDAAQVTSNGEMVTENEDAGNQQKPEGAVDHPNSNLTSKLDTKDSVTENSGNVESNPDTTTKSAKPFVSETVHGEDRAEKSPEMVVSIQKQVESEVANAPSQSSSQQEESQSKIKIKKGFRSKKKGPNQSDPPSTVAVLTKVNEGTSDLDTRSPKRARKKTQKAEDNKTSVTSGSDVETVKNLGKKVETGDSGPKPAKRSGKKVGGGGSVAKKPKLSHKKVSESNKSKQDDKKVLEAGDSEVKPAKRSLKKDNGTDSDSKPLKQSGKKGQKSKVITNPSEFIENKDEETDSDNKPLKPSENKEEKTDADRKALILSENKEEEETDSDNIPLKMHAKRGKKRTSSVVKSSLKNKDGKKQEVGKTVDDKDETKSLSEDDDGMDVSLNSVLKKVAKGKGILDGSPSTSSKRKRSTTTNKVTGTIKYDDSLVGLKVKVWWPHDKMYYEGAIESFDSETNRHKISYTDGDEEILNLKTEKWEILEFPTPNKKVADKVQNTDVLPEIAGSSKGENKDTLDEETEKVEKEEKPKKIVYSRGRKGSKSKTKSSEGNVKEPEAEAAAAAEPASEKDPKIGSKIGTKRKKTI